MIPHMRRRQDSENPKDVEDALLNGVIVQRRIIAAVPEIPVLKYAVAQVCGLADVDAGVSVEAQDAVEVDASPFEFEISTNAFETVYILDGNVYQSMNMSILRVDVPSPGQETPNIRPDAFEAKVFQLCMSCDPFPVSGIVL